MLHILMASAFAFDVVNPDNADELCVLTKSEMLVVKSPMDAYVDWYESHGPEKPPPDDGYEFKGAKGGNALGKLGLLSMGAGLVTSVMYLKADSNSDRKSTLGYTTAGLFGGGLLMLVIERAT